MSFIWCSIIFNTWNIVIGLNRSDSKDKSRINGNDSPLTVESWLFGLGFQDFVNAFIEFGYDNLDFIVSISWMFNKIKNVYNIHSFDI